MQPLLVAEMIIIAFHDTFSCILLNIPLHMRTGHWDIMFTTINVR